MKRIAFKIITTVIALGVILGLLVASGYLDTHYDTVAEVLSVDDTETLFVDGAGYVWGVYDTDFRKGEFVRLYFDNNTTDYTRNDDKIVKVKRLDN
jgi:hypothetical protein